MSSNRRTSSTRRGMPPVRLTLAGTRVIILQADAERVAGIITEVRHEPPLRPYVVTCDDGVVRFASGYELALETDSSVTPLEQRPEY